MKSKDYYKTRSIVLSWMYSGRYPMENSNIGHEVINFKLADNGKRYIYICKDGKCPLRYANFKKGVTGAIRQIDTVLLVQTVIGTKKIEVLAKATGCKPLLDEKGNLVSGNGSFAEKNGIHYDGVSLTDIFSQNIFNKELEGNDVIFLTFEVDNVVKPAKRLFLSNVTNDVENGVFQIQKHISAEPGKEFFDKDINAADFAILDGLVRDESLWRNSEEKTEVSEDDPSFLLLSDRYHDELTYSNLLAFFLASGNGILDAFFEKVLSITGLGSDKTTNAMEIAREDNRIDLAIRYKGHYVVIENKIRSGINGNQLERYARAAFDKCEKRSLTPHFYFFVPKYNVAYNKLELELNLEGRNVQYKVVYYDALYDFFKNFYNSTGVRPPQSDEFIKALKLQVREMDNFTDEIMSMRFEAMRKRQQQSPLSSCRQ